MSEFTGSSVKKITQRKLSDVVLRDIASLEGLVDIADAEVLEIGTLLVSADAGKTWSVAVETDEPNGVLIQPLEQTQNATVLVMGIVKEANLPNLVETQKAALFANKIILK